MADTKTTSRGRGKSLLPGNILRQKLAPGRYSDGAGLYLLVTPTSRSWLFFFTTSGRRREMGLGSAGDATGAWSLTEARQRADEARSLLKAGHDPLEYRKAAAEAAEAADRAKASSAVTFGEMADAYVDGGTLAGKKIVGQTGSFRNNKHVAQWRMTLGERYCGNLRKRPVADVSTEDVLEVLQPIWQTKNETASRIRGRIERVLDAARAAGFRQGENPARWRGHLDHLLSKRQKLQRGHHAAMPREDVPAFLKELRTRDAVSARALEFLILTASRSGEVRGADWSEIDLEARIWTVPGSRMKAGREHRVPLTDRAISILEEMAAAQGTNGTIFVTSGGRIMSDMTLAKMLARLDGGAYTVHGFRSTFRDWAFEVSRHPRDIAEAALAHVFGDATERAYRRGDALEKRREMMNDWQSYIERPPSAFRVLRLTKRKG